MARSVYVNDIKKKGRGKEKRNRFFLRRGRQGNHIPHRKGKKRAAAYYILFRRGRGERKTRRAERSCKKGIFRSSSASHSFYCG